MSFPKAKIRRFNDTPDSTPLPGPGQYNPTIKTKPIGAYIPGGDRFKEPPPSPTVSETGSTGGSVKSAPSTSFFAVPKKPTATKFHQTPKHAQQTKLQSDHQEALKEKIVECQNKDMFIKELNDQIEDFKMQLGELKRRNSQLDEEKKNYEVKSERLRKDHENAICNINQKHQDELSELNDKISLINQELLQTKTEMIELKEANKEEFRVLLENVSKFEHLYNTTCAEYKKVLAEKNEQIKNKETEIQVLKNKMSELTENFNRELERLQLLHKSEREELELEMLKNYTENQQLVQKTQRECTKKIQELETKITKIEQENEVKVKQIQEDSKEANLLTEMQMKERQIEIEQEWKVKLEAQDKEFQKILKECQEISEYTIMQGEFEKNNIKNKLNEKEVQCEDLCKEKDALKAQIENLQRELSKIITELNEAHQKLGQEVAKHNETLQKALKEKHTYEFTISKTHETIEALKTRLFNSDRDVNQLKSELETCECSKLEYESKCNELKDEIKTLQEQNDELEMQNESTLRQALEDVSNVEKELLKKMGGFHHNLIQNVNELNSKLLTAETNLQEAMEQLHEQQRSNCEAQILLANANLEIERLEGINTENEYVKKRLESTINNLQKTLDEVSKNEKALKDALEEAVNKKQECDKEKLELKNSLHESHLEIENYRKQITEHAEMSKEFTELLKNYEEEKTKREYLENYCTKLEKQVKEDAELIGPFREQLKEYELERKALLEETKDIRLKYAEILGHQNLKQKIRHVVNLKQRNQELTESKTELEAKVRAQAKTIEKLKKEVAQLTKSPRKLFMQCEDDKENLSPAKNVVWTGSPGPLRDRQFNTPVKPDENI